MDTAQIIITLSKVLPPYVKKYDNFKEGDFIQYSGQWWDEEEMSLALTALVTGSWITSGENVEKFQTLFSKRFNVNHSHMVNSGSSANLVMITALKKAKGWKDGDEVIVSPVGFPTTIAPICQNNLTPVFADIEMDTLNFDLNEVERKITNKTRAIFVSPVLGNPPDMDRLQQICSKYGLMLVGDNCDSLGTQVNGQLITDLYYCWSTSFYPAHHISTGEGGMISSNDEEFIKLVRSISWWGRDCYCVGSSNLSACGTCGKRFSNWLDSYDGVIDHKYLFSNMGYNLKPLDLQGAIGIAQLKKFDTIDDLRRKYKNAIDDSLEKLQGVRTIKALEGNDPSWFGVPVVCDTQERKEFLVSYLESNKIQTRNYFSGNILLHPGYSHLDDASKYPNANKALSNVFFIGCSPLYTAPVLDYICKTIEKFDD